jgi:hypothetical protein
MVFLIMIFEWGALLHHLRKTEISHSLRAAGTHPSSLSASQAILSQQDTQIVLLEPQFTTNHRVAGGIRHNT